MLKINELKIKIEQMQNDLSLYICDYLNINKSELLGYKIKKRSLDARKKEQFFYSYILSVTVKDELAVLKRNGQKVVLESPAEYRLPEEDIKFFQDRPVVIGFGPAGMFAALVLAEKGLRPLVFERGEKVEERTETVHRFWNSRVLNPESNIQFGEGGAGTFSDGKLTTRVKDLRSSYILQEFAENGANPEIQYVHNPHIGTDVLVNVVKNIREKIRMLGGEIHFSSRLTDIEITNGKVSAVFINGERITCSEVILAVGNSARDTFSLLYEKGVDLSQKAFAVGLRIEHPQLLINKSQYGNKYFHDPRLDNAEYKLTYQADNGRSVYTFCMCPGGAVVAASSEIDTVVVNGMSEFARDRQNANSALVCTVDEHDFHSAHPLAGMYFQRELEKKAFELGGSNYDAPVQLVGDFLINQTTENLGKVEPSYQIGYRFTDLSQLFSGEITEALKEAVISLDHKLHGFALKDAVLTGVETRTSSPIRINRDPDTGESLNVSGLYPAGEGAGYAGGIMSSAIDGIKAAERIISKYIIG